MRINIVDCVLERRSGIEVSAGIGLDLPGIRAGDRQRALLYERNCRFRNWLAVRAQNRSSDSSVEWSEIRSLRKRKAAEQNAHQQQTFHDVDLVMENYCTLETRQV